MRSFLLGISVVVSFGTACGGGATGGRPGEDGGIPPADASVDVVRPPGVTCPPAAAGEKRSMGACCAAAADCAGGVCWNGFCTKVCATSAECGVVAGPSPLPTGTLMSCVTNKVGDSFTYCLPGSASGCGNGGGGGSAASTADCPAGEACALGLDPAATQARPAPPASIYRGVCLTKLVANQYLPVGSICQPEDGPYVCENEGGYLGSGCFAHRCTQACGATGDCPLGMDCQPAPFSTKLGGAVAFQPSNGPGVCMGRACGQVHGIAGLQAGAGLEQGADASCVGDDICVPTIAVGATGDTQFLSCVPPRPGALAFGAACSRDPAVNLRCADDSLCAARGPAHFCSRLCRIDADCPTGSFCVDDFPSSPLPNGSVARLAMCTPRTLIPGVACHGERDCAPTEACRPASGRSNLLLCQPAVGAKAVGQACAAAGECRSGECVDRDLQTPTGSNRTSCGGYCAKNSDCAARQICLRVVRDNNDTVNDPRDDVAFGFCTPLTAPALTGGCTTDDNCTGQISIDETGGDTCEPVLGTCYSRAARIGDACQHRADCPLGAYCRLNDPRFPGGACVSQGCDPSAQSGVDSCPVGALCVERPLVDGPLKSCYGACVGGTNCARAAEGYACEAPSPGATVTICLGQGGP